jgi:hypothetical protein
MILYALMALQAAASATSAQPADEVVCRSVDMRVATTALVTRQVQVCRTGREWALESQGREATIALNLSRRREHALR